LRSFRPTPRILEHEEGLPCLTHRAGFPGQPNLRFLRLEARRRVAAGEFSALHDAQLTIAWEHGQSSWTELRQLINSWLAQLDHRACPMQGPALPSRSMLLWINGPHGGGKTRDGL